MLEQVPTLVCGETVTRAPAHDAAAGAAFLRARTARLRSSLRIVVPTRVRHGDALAPVFARHRGGGREHRAARSCRLLDADRVVYDADEAVHDVGA